MINTADLTVTTHKQTIRCCICQRDLEVEFPVIDGETYFEIYRIACDRHDDAQIWGLRRERIPAADRPIPDDAAELVPDDFRDWHARNRDQCAGIGVITAWSTASIRKAYRDHQNER